MAGLNPLASVYIPLGTYYSSPCDVQSSCDVFNQASVQITPYLDCCLYPPPPPPHAIFYSCWKGFAWVEIAPMPLQLPESHEKPTLTLLKEEEAEEEVEEKIDGNLVPETKVNEEVKFGATVEAPKGFKGFGCGGSFVVRRRVFVPKARNRREVMQPLNKRKKSLEFEFKKDEGGAIEVDDEKTTVMIKNLPNKFTKDQILVILDQHCYEENQKIKKEGNEKPSELGGGENSSPTLSEFDFLYLPIDFNTASNMGYAFVNFTSAVAAWRLYNFLHNYDWKPHGSRKTCVVAYARIQGLAALQQHFKNSTFACHCDDFLPVCFIPARNGYCQTEQQYIGKRFPVSSPLTHEEERRENN